MLYRRTWLNERGSSQPCITCPKDEIIPDFEHTSHLASQALRVPMKDYYVEKNYPAVYVKSREIVDIT